MNTNMIDRFEDTIAAMTDAEFNTFWQEVQQESGEGPLAVTFITDFPCGPSCVRIVQNE